MRLQNEGRFRQSDFDRRYAISNLCLLGHFEGVIDLDPQVSDGTFKFRWVNKPALPTGPTSDTTTVASAGSRPCSAMLAWATPYWRCVLTH